MDCFVPRSAFGRRRCFAPLICSIVRYRVRSFLHYFFFLRPGVFESCVSAESFNLLVWTIFFLFNMFKSRECCIHRAISSWSWFFVIPLWISVKLKLMLLDPILIWGFIFSDFENLIMRIMCPRSWRLISQKLCILVIKMLFSNKLLLFLHQLHQSIFFFHGFL